jgi:hypothetical protein
MISCRCIALTQEQAYEMLLACFVALEAYMYYPGCNLDHNLYEIALPIMEELQFIRRSNNNPLGQLSINKEEFTSKRKKLRTLVSEISFKTFLPKDYEDPECLLSEADRKAFHPETIKLLAEEIPSVVAYEEDHSLRNPAAIKRARKNSVTAKDTKVVIERGEKIVCKIEELFDCGKENTVKNTPWHKLLSTDSKQAHEITKNISKDYARSSSTRKSKVEHQTPEQRPSISKQPSKLSK